MKAILKYSFIIIILLACHREKANYIGPAYISAPDGFAVTSFTATPSSVDFTLNTVSFNANFTSAVTWTLTITGQTSGATHVIQGTGNGINNVIWTGRHDGVAFFKNGENATAVLSFYGSTYTSSPITINITNVPNYKTCGTFSPGGDFETAKVSTDWHPFNNPPIPNVVNGDSLGFVTQAIGSAEVDYNGNKVSSIQGNSYYFIRGYGAQANYVSGIQYDKGSFLNPLLPTNADDVWVNIYLYGTGDANTQVEIEYQEADANDKKSPGVYKGTDDDAFVKHIVLDHKGWKLFSFQYSKLTPSLNKDFGGSGNQIHEPNRLRSFDLVLVKRLNANSPVEVYFDFPIITVGGPFKPCK